MSEHTTPLRCPFCNGTPELRKTGGWSGIGCNTNKCPAYLHALMFRTPGEAIAAWNRRSYATALWLDARRYRWLRDKSNGAPDNTPTVYSSRVIAARMLDSRVLHGEGMDAAIDAALSAAPSEGETK